MRAAHNAETVKVIVRCRPMNEKEISENYERYCINAAKFLLQITQNSLSRIVNVLPKRGAVEIQTPTKPPTSREFTFDAVYDSK